MRYGVFARAFALVVLLFAALPTTVDSCAISVRSIFFYTRQPEADLKQVITGNLGVIHPQWGRRYLFLAYRLLSAKPFSQAEAEALLRSGLYRAVADEGPNASGKRERQKQQPLQEWLKARALVMKNEAPKIETTRMEESSFAEYVVCPDDAFITATATLKQRIAEFGAENPHVRNWAEAQDVVFQNCDPKTDTSPGPTLPEAPKIFEHDREYQVAAADFYAGRWEDSRKEFEEIGKTKGSPWAVWGDYLAARTLIRQSTLSENAEAQTLLPEAAARLRTIAQTTKDARVKTAALRTLDYVRVRTEPQQYFSELERVLANGLDAGELDRHLKDYLFFLYKGWPKESNDPDVKPPSASPIGPEKADPVHVDATTDMTDWIEYMENGTDAATVMARARALSTQSMPWMVAAMMHASGKGSPTDQLLAIAAKVPVSSPAYMTLTYHRARILAELGKTEEANAICRRVLERGDIGPSARALFQQRLIKSTPSVDEFISHATAPLIGEIVDESDEGPTKPVQALLPETVRVLNHRVPTKTIQLWVEQGKFPQEAMRGVVASAWTRAVLLGQYGIARDLAPLVSREFPEVKPLMNGFLEARNAQDQLHAVLFLLVKTPGFRPYFETEYPLRWYGEKPPAISDIDSGRWWCSLPNEWRRVEGTDDDNVAAFAKPQPSAAEEEERLRGLDAAPEFLGWQIIRWAKQEPDDARIPEALHQVVRSTRFGCYEAPHTEVSKAAFTLLHSRYPKSEWAKKTKYYF